MKVLITGGTGLLGQALLGGTTPSGVELSATYCSGSSPGKTTVRFYRLDVTDSEAVMRLFNQVKPDAVIHTASIGSVDYAELNREESWDVNVGGTRNVARACHRHGAKMVFISSNAVFDGEHPPYTEMDVVCPINYYGELKVEGESVTKDASENVAIVRPILMYGWNDIGHRGNLVTFWLDSLEKGESVRAVNDVWSKPLQAENCAEVCWAILTQGRVGIYHVAGADHVTLYRFAIKVAVAFGYDPDLVKPVPGSYFRQLAPRPTDTSFVTDKMERELNVSPVGLEEGLTRMKSVRPH